MWVYWRRNTQSRDETRQCRPVVPCYSPLLKKFAGPPTLRTGFPVGKPCCVCSAHLPFELGGQFLLACLSRLVKCFSQCAGLRYSNLLASRYPLLCSVTLLHLICGPHSMTPKALGAVCHLSFLALAAALPPTQVRLELQSMRNWHSADGGFRTLNLGRLRRWLRLRSASCINAEDIMLAPMSTRSWAGCISTTRHAGQVQEAGPVRDDERSKAEKVLLAQVDCRIVFKNMLSKVEASPRAGPPPERIPEKLLDDYLLGGLVNLTHWYFNERHHGETKPYDWNVALLGTRSSASRLACLERLRNSSTSCVAL